ncbi:hypothetical protein RJG79_04910 [Mycoplasmatota bacterium WC44]
MGYRGFFIFMILFIAWLYFKGYKKMMEIKDESTRFIILIVIILLTLVLEFNLIMITLSFV